jgi:hypothetical protein
MLYTQEIKDKISDLAKNSSDNCTSIGFGFKEVNGELTDERALIFRFKEKKPISDLLPSEIVPKTITVGNETLQTDVCQGEDRFVAYEACPSSFYSWSSNSSLNPTGSTTPSQQSEIRPIKGGLQVRNQTKGWVGTMGFVAVDNETNSIVGVTNAHVMTEIFFRANESGRGVENVYGDDIGQPSSSVSQQVGVTKRYVPVQGNASGGINYVDGALFTLDSSSINTSQSYQYYGLSFTGAPEFATTEEIDDLINNNYEFYSVGRTTGAKGEGVTKLKFLSYDTVYVNNNLTPSTERLCRYDECISYIASANTTTNGNGCYYPINSGDSGSALLANIDGTVKIIGLCFAGSTSGSVDGYFTIGRACRIDRVAEELNISAFTGQSINYSDTTIPQVHYEAGFSSLSSVTINGNKFHQLGTVN